MTARRDIALVFLVTFSALDCKLIPELIEDYDKSEVPDLSVPTENQIGITVSQYDLDTSNGVMFMDLYFRQSWRDARLSHNSNLTSVRLPNGWNRVWVPDIFVPTAKKFIMFDRPTPQQLLRVSPGGDVIYSSRVQLEIYCPGLQTAGLMSRLVNCSLQFESFGSTLDEWYFAWTSPAPVNIRNSAGSNSGFSLMDTYLFNRKETLSTGVYGRLEAIFQFKKHFIGQRSIRSVDDPRGGAPSTEWNEHLIDGTKHVIKRRSVEVPFG